MMTDMRTRLLMRGGGGVAVAALSVLGVYLARVGLDAADKLASVIGLFVAAAGLGSASMAYWPVTARAAYIRRPTNIRPVRANPRSQGTRTTMISLRSHHCG